MRRKLVIFLSITSILVTGCQNDKNNINSKTESQNDDVKPLVELEKPKNETKLSNNTFNTNVIDQIDKNKQTALNYFESEADYIKHNTTKENFNNIKDRAVNTIKDGIDFIFYNKEINGITFNELSEEIKQKVINALIIIDNKIMEYEPNYKDKIGEKYSIIKNFTMDTINKTKIKITETIGENNITIIKEKGSEIAENTKETVSNTWGEIKKWFKRDE